jgi:hypothetical protein
MLGVLIVVFLVKEAFGSGPEPVRLFVKEANRSDTTFHSSKAALTGCIRIMVSRNSSLIQRQ